MSTEIETGFAAIFTRIGSLENKSKLILEEAKSLAKESSELMKLFIKELKKEEKAQKKREDELNKREEQLNKREEILKKKEAKQAPEEKEKETKKTKSEEKKSVTKLVSEEKEIEPVEVKKPAKKTNKKKVVEPIEFELELVEEEEPIIIPEKNNTNKNKNKHKNKNTNKNKNKFIVHNYTKNYEKTLESVSSNDSINIESDEEMLLERNGITYKVIVYFEFTWSCSEGLMDAVHDLDIYEKSNGEEYTQEEYDSILSIAEQTYN